MNINSFKKVHMVGIKGSGLSSLANVFRSRGIEVTGSDMQLSGHRKENVSIEADCLVCTVAVTADNPEIAYAKEKGIPVFSYPEMLGLISETLFTVAIAGTHGKTTTTNMVGKILTDAGLAPLVIAGGAMQDRKSMCGNGKYFVVEACEYRRSFLNIHPDIAIITNIDDDHLDYYKNREDIENAFSEFVGNLKKGGIIIRDFQNSEYENKLELKIPGEHNLKNALNALGAALELGVDAEVAIESLNNFSGVERRFEFKGKNKNMALVFDDYAHHPTEIKATISAAREAYPNSRLSIFFQPHLYSRTRQLFENFEAELCSADEIILLPIFASREAFDPTITSGVLALAINKRGGNAKVMSADEAVRYASTINSDSVIMTVGAGDVTKMGDRIVVQPV
jgi:UDP-N-acetylmuramate--alanine ligase